MPQWHIQRKHILLYYPNKNARACPNRARFSLILVLIWFFPNNVSCLWLKKIFNLILMLISKPAPFLLPSQFTANLIPEDMLELFFTSQDLSRLVLYPKWTSLGFTFTIYLNVTTYLYPGYHNLWLRLLQWSSNNMSPLLSLRSMFSMQQLERSH